MFSLTRCRASVRRVLLSFMVVLTLSGCAAPLLPAAREPRVDREELTDASMLEQLREDWQLLMQVHMDPQERGVVMRRYNERLLQLLHRLRYDIKTANNDERTEHLLKMLNISDETVAGEPILRYVYEDIVPAADVPVDLLEEHYALPGIGVPVVGVVPEENLQRVSGRLAPVKSAGTVNIMTVLLEFPAHRDEKPLLRFISRTENETVRIGRLQYELAADFSAGIEVYWNLTNLKKNRFLGLFRPQELRDVTGLSCMEAYDGEKIPVVLTHGLMSSADTFANLVNRMLKDEEVRKNYQFWYFNYPTGVSWTFTARQFRESLRAMRDKMDPQRRNKYWDRLVLVGHSMGGLITHYNQCVEPWLILRGSKLRHLDFTPYMSAKYIKQPLPINQFEVLRGGFFFRPVEANLVVYMATPHRGAPMARYRIVTWLTSLVRLPEQMLTELVNIATLQQDNIIMNPAKVREWFTSVDQLAPDSWSITGLQGLKVRNVPTHSVIGNKKGGPLETSSDGIVPYWSSHISWGGETVVQSGHSVQDVEETAETLINLLKDNLKQHPRRHSHL